MLKLFWQVGLTWHASGYARPHALPKSRKPVKVLSNNLTFPLDPDGGGLYLMRVETTNQPNQKNQMTTENENQEPANSPVHTYAANLSALLCQGIRETLKQADSAHARCLVVSALETELTKLRKIVRPAFEVEVARRSLDRLEANYRVIKQGKPELEDIQTWDGIIRAAQRKLAKAETELSRTPPLV